MMATTCPMGVTVLNKRKNAPKSSSIRKPPHDPAKCRKVKNQSDKLRQSTKHNTRGSYRKLIRSPIPLPVSSPCVAIHILIVGRGEREPRVEGAGSARRQMVITRIPDGRVHEGIERQNLAIGL